MITIIIIEKNHQFIHRLGFACVRVSRSGFVWLLNSAGRVSDLSNTKDTKGKKDSNNEEKDDKNIDITDDDNPMVTNTTPVTTNISTINRNTAMRTFQELRNFCESVAICYGIFIDIIEDNVCLT